MARPILGSSLLIFALLTVAANPTAGRTIHVDCDGGGEYLSIQEGINAATHGDTVLVAPCTYSERLVIGPAVDGIVLLSEAGPDFTIVDGQGTTGAPLLTCQDVGADVLVGGFTFMRGKTVLASGAGVRCERADVRLVGNVIKDCWANGGMGGGVFAEDSNIEIIGCTVEGNRSDDGGGILIMWGSSRIESNTIAANRADGFHGSNTGGGVSVGEGSHCISGNTFVGNEAAEGGAIAVQGATNALLEGNHISTNSAWYYGGALLISDAPAIVSSNVIVANTVGIGGNGGAAIIGGVGGPPPIEPPTFTGNIFFENNAGSGGAIGVFQSGPLPVFHDNYLVDDATYQVLVHDTPSIDTLDFSGNWWGTDDPAAIAARIYDSSDDPLLLWTVDFSGWCVDASCSGGVTGIYETEPQLETWSRIKNAYR